jgi:hypothetical protein
MSGGDLAYVFWHWPRGEVPAAEYEARQRAFHHALAETPPRGFRRSWTVAVADLPWTPAEGTAYEDWYLVGGFADLGELNEGAVTGARQPSHDRAARVARGGAGGIYRLKAGEPVVAPARACWFGKPEGMAYAQLLEILAPVVEEAAGALWMRQMVLGPGAELCLHLPDGVAEEPSLPPELDVLTVGPRPVWPAAHDP